MPAVSPARKSQGKFKLFSIQNFKELYNRSEAKEYLSAMDKEQIKVAVEKKDTALLEKLYPILLKERADDHSIVQEFVMTKNRIVDDFMIKATEIEKRLIETPRRKVIAAEEAKEKFAAEHILKNL